VFICLWNACQRSDTSQSDEPPATGAQEAWVEGLQAARQERATLTEAMQALFRVSLNAHEGSLVELALANLSDRAVAEYGGLLHLRDPEGERVCTLWLSEQELVPADESPRRVYDVEGAFATDATPVSELQGAWAPYRIVFEDGEVMAKPWPTQSWWPWCQSYLSRRAE
jgi:hypothetical protein